MFTEICSLNGSIMVLNPSGFWTIILQWSSAPSVSCDIWLFGFSFPTLVKSDSCLLLRNWMEWLLYVACLFQVLQKKIVFVHEQISSPPCQLVDKTPVKFCRSREWETSEGNCYNEKTPIKDEGYWGSGSDLPTMRMVERVLNSVSSKVSVINITQLSDYRRDGHPSIYRKFWETLSPEQLSNPVSYSDCIHWCLPGVPDVWNELLFQFL